MAILSIVEFQDTSGDIMVARVPMDGTAEFGMGSQLIVQDGQLAIFYRDGQPCDMFKAGRHTLNTQNMPIITKLMNLAVYGMKVPFRAYVYFAQLKTFTNLGWGTPTPVLFRDSEFKAVHLRANGMFSIRIGDASTFLRTLVASKGLETTYAVQEYIRSVVVSRFGSYLPTVLTTVLDLPAQYREIATGLKNEVKEDLEQYGIELVDLLVEAITVPPEVQQMIDRAAGSRSLDQSELQRYQTVAMSDAVRDASKQPGGGGGAIDGLGLGAGLAMGKQMLDSAAEQRQATPPDLPQAVQWYAAIGGQKTGPMGQDALQAHISSGQVAKETLVWRQGMADWQQAGQMAELTPLFGVSPPPMPQGE